MSDDRSDRLVNILYGEAMDWPEEKRAKLLRAIAGGDLEGGLALAGKTKHEGGPEHDQASHGNWATGRSEDDGPEPPPRRGTISQEQPGTYGKPPRMPDTEYKAARKKWDAVNEGRKKRTVLGDIHAEAKEIVAKWGSHGRGRQYHELDPRRGDNPTEETQAKIKAVLDLIETQPAVARMQLVDLRGMTGVDEQDVFAIKSKIENAMTWQQHVDGAKAFIERAAAVMAVRAREDPTSPSAAKAPEIIHQLELARDSLGRMEEPNPEYKDTLKVHPVARLVWAGDLKRARDLADDLPFDLRKEVIGAIGVAQFHLDQDVTTTKSGSVSMFDDAESVAFAEGLGRQGPQFFHRLSEDDPEFYATAMKRVANNWAGIGGVATTVRFAADQAFGTDGPIWDQDYGENSGTSDEGAFIKREQAVELGYAADGEMTMMAGAMRREWTETQEDLSRIPVPNEDEDEDRPTNTGALEPLKVQDDFSSEKRYWHPDEEADIPLWRGVEVEIDGYVSGPVESWSSEYHVARGFGGNVMKQRIPRSRILVFQGSRNWSAVGAGLTENEFLVLSSEPDWTQDTRDIGSTSGGRQ